MGLGSLAFFFLASFILTSFSTQAANLSSPLCLKRTLTDITALEGDLCYPHLLEDNCTPKVLQVDGREMKKALSLGRWKGRSEFTALLFYSKWSPFSLHLRDVFDTLSIVFPDVNHIAVESSTLWPSELSEHGVRSFPALFVINKTLKFKFYGARTWEAITEFYMEKTGYMPIAVNYSLDEDKLLPRRQADKKKPLDFYLAFSVLFLMLRCLFYIQPRLAAVLRKVWNPKERSLKAQKGIPRLAIAEQRKREERVSGKGKSRHNRKEDRDSGKGVLSVPSWPSPSFAAVALAECSSRNVATEDTTKKSPNVS